MKIKFLKFLPIAAAVLLVTSCSKDDGYERNVVVIKNSENNDDKKIETNDEKTPETIVVTGITLDKTTLEITVGETVTLTATVTPETATDKTVTWSSADESIATVDAEGKVTAVAVGTVKITATANDGSNVKAECEVTVKAATVLSGVLVDGATIKVNFKWRDENSGDYVQGVYNAQTGTFTVSKGGYYWGPDGRAVCKVEKSGDNIIIGVGIYNYDMEGMVWTFDTTNDTYTYTLGRMLSSNPDEYGLISVTLNGTDITSQLTAQ
ncbi:MAG: Ig domain-containing protein [Bacteroidales bacterium]|nr:Ig domain-containing protein [Bacteroidales bacterium]